MKKFLFLLVILLSFSGTSYSIGSMCKDKPRTREESIKILNLTGKIIDYLDENNADLAFIARKNKDNHGVTYTHIGIAWKEDNGRWVMTNLLQSCEDRSVLATYDDGLALFFAPVKTYKSLVLIPSGETQKELKEAVKNKEIERFKGEQYSINANPWEDKYQNCVQYVLESYSYAKAGRTFETRREAIDWYRENGFKPQKIKVNLLERVFGPMITTNVKFDDHKGREKNNEIEVATPVAVMRFIQKMEPESVMYEVK